MPKVATTPRARAPRDFNLTKTFEAANENEVGLAPEFRTHGKRMVALTGEVTQEKADNICLAMLNMALAKPKEDILFYINSRGGSVTAGMAIFDMMRRINCDVRTVGIGQCSSMGAFLVAAGTKGKRSIFPNASVMMHQPSAGTQGMVSDMERDFGEFQRIKTRMNRLLALFLDISREDCEKLTDRNTYINALAAQKLGVIDRIVSKWPEDNKDLSEDDKKLFATEMEGRLEEMAAQPELLAIIARRSARLLAAPPIPPSASPPQSGGAEICVLRGDSVKEAFDESGQPKQAGRRKPQVKAGILEP